MTANKSVTSRGSSSSNAKSTSAAATSNSNNSNNINQQQQQQQTDQLTATFKAAALAVTQLYKESQKQKTRAFDEGYQQCLEDLTQFLMAVSSSSSSSASTSKSSSSMDDLAEPKSHITFAIEDLDAFFRKKQADLLAADVQGMDLLSILRGPSSLLEEEEVEVEVAEAEDDGDVQSGQTGHYDNHHHHHHHKPIANDVIITSSSTTDVPMPGLAAAPSAESIQLSSATGAAIPSGTIAATTNPVPVPFHQQPPLAVFQFSSPSTPTAPSPGMTSTTSSTSAAASVNPSSSLTTPSSSRLFPSSLYSSSNLFDSLGQLGLGGSDANNNGPDGTPRRRSLRQARNPSANNAHRTFSNSNRLGLSSVAQKAAAATNSAAAGSFGFENCNNNGGGNMFPMNGSAAAAADLGTLGTSFKRRWATAMGNNNSINNSNNNSGFPEFASIFGLNLADFNTTSTSSLANNMNNNMNNTSNNRGMSTTTTGTNNTMNGRTFATNNRHNRPSSSLNQHPRAAGFAANRNTVDSGFLDSTNNTSTSTSMDPNSSESAMMVDGGPALLKRVKFDESSNTGAVEQQKHDET